MTEAWQHTPGVGSEPQHRGSEAARLDEQDGSEIAISHSSSLLDDPAVADSNKDQRSTSTYPVDGNSLRKALDRGFRKVRRRGESSDTSMDEDPGEKRRRVCGDSILITGISDLSQTGTVKICKPASAYFTTKLYQQLQQKERHELPKSFISQKWSLTIVAAEEANRAFSSLLRSEMFDTSPQTETNQKWPTLPLIESPKPSQPHINLSTHMSSRGFGKSKKRKKRETAPGSMARHSMTSHQSDNIQKASATPFLTTLDSQEANCLEILIASQLENGLPGPEILSKLLSKQDLRAVRYIIKNHYRKVAQGKFDWLLDLREAGYSDDAILDSLLESTESGPWTTSNFHESWKFEEHNSDFENMFFRIFINLITFTKALIVETLFLSLMVLIGAPILVDRAVLDQAVVSMIPIALEDVAAFHVTALELYRQHAYTSKIETGQAHDDIVLSVNSELHRKLSMCWVKGRASLSGLLSSETPQFPVDLSCNISLQLHECVLACQFLAVAIVSYAQAHTSDFHPHFLKEPIETLILQGYAGYRCWTYEKETIELSYKQLACMSDLVGGKVIVFRMLDELPLKPPTISGSDAVKSRGEQERPAEATGSLFVGSIEDIIDSWGPGVLISDPELGVPYGDKIKSVLIGSGAITHVTNEASHVFHPLYHFGRSYDLADTIPTFNIWDRLTTGAISVQKACPLDPAKCRKSSEPYLDALGTCNNHWSLTERQMILQAGQYVGLQVGNVYSKVKGGPLKTTVLEMWSLVHDFRILLQPWGLRAPLRELIEEPMFLYIDKLALPGWDEIKSDIRTAFGGSIDEYISWTTGLKGSKRECLVQVITIFLEVLKDTGVDREGKRLRMLWPDKSSLSHAISLKCDKSNLWARVLQDSPSCATFAALTRTCLEAPGHSCKKNQAPIWTGKGALLSTAVCRVLVPGDVGVLGLGTNHWELQNGQRCWIGKPGSEVWVYTSKTPNSEAQLTVKINRFPKGFSILRDWQVLRERQDAAFEAEEVVVYGTMA
ncbi:uncharacterized protein LY89DRAFT_673387 [Mollisia scopiformis]|uniref:Uncharacterized protein n=1 Tax=Mollisia scopiformis TaxID=149040 RepID=A0A194WWQ3_MOLSC|nr:uncharacterized protein LY89DRAFT_673387 [Mollisia scopiformis]KUJ12406.1 hypothetical protein LY89DRAFT_673387 [Mollisia scopiformis]